MRDAAKSGEKGAAQHVDPDEALDASRSHGEATEHVGVRYANPSLNAAEASVYRVDFD